MPKHKNRPSIPAPKLPENEKIKFSFEFYDGSKYCLSGWGIENIKKALMRLKEVCGVSFNDLRRGSSVYHFHEVDWLHTNEKRGFPNSANQLSPFQFAVLGVNNQKARVYGAYSSGTFCIVWFDFNHYITPSVLKNT